MWHIIIAAMCYIVTGAASTTCKDTNATCKTAVVEHVPGATLLQKAVHASTELRTELSSEPSPSSSSSLGGEETPESLGYTTHTNKSCWHKLDWHFTTLSAAIRRCELLSATGCSAVVDVGCDKGAGDTGFVLCGPRKDDDPPFVHSNGLYDSSGSCAFTDGIAPTAAPPLTNKTPSPTAPEGTPTPTTQGITMAELQAFNGTLEGSVHVLTAGMQNPEAIGNYWNTAMLRDMPAYGVNPKSVADIQKAVTFAKTHGLKVSVKNHGHSITGQSAGAGSLLIYMGENFKGVAVKRGAYYDSCGTWYEDVLYAEGGSTWMGVYEEMNRTGRDFASVGGTCDTVGAAGGWLLGNGLSYEHGRSFGLGPDVVIDFEVVLADGRHVVVDACSEPELFKAMRGGGPGWATIISVHYQLFDGGSSTEGFIGFNRTLHNGSTDPWWEWLVRWAPVANENWTIGAPWDTGLMGADGVFMLRVFYKGTKAEAEAAPLFQEIKALWEAVPPEARLASKKVWGVMDRGNPDELLTEYPSFPEFQLSAYIPSSPFAGDMSDTSNPTYYRGNRLIPAAFLVDQPTEALQFFKMLESRMCPFGIMYPLGGKMAQYDPDGNLTSVTPNLRKSIYQIGICSEVILNESYRLFPNDVGGGLQNHAGYHSVDRGDWFVATWGQELYAELLATKNKYDPEGLFHCRGCIGSENSTYTGSTE